MYDAGMREIVRPQGEEGTDWHMRLLSADEDFLDAFDIELVAGRGFSKQISTDRTEAFLLNEAAVRALGWTDPIGKRFGWDDREGRVIGVMRDFHIESLREEIAPVFLCRSRLYSLALKIRAGKVSETMAFIREKTRARRPERGFEYEFLDEALERRYESEKQLGRVAGVFSALAIFLACMGLFGLVSFAVQRRTKEIGVRQALGASTLDVASLLSWDILKLVLLANLVAWPISYFAAERWLQNFAYRIDVNVWTLVGTSALILSVAAATVGGQAVKAARANPVVALRSE